MQLPLPALDDHLFVELDNRKFLVDTGAPSSFGAGESVTLASITFPLPAAQMGLITTARCFRGSARLHRRDAT